MSTTLQRIAYSPLWLLLHAVALLPFGALYVLSDALAWVAASVVRYRRRLVEANIAAAFPDKTEAERRDIVKRFYRNFTDVFVETISCCTSAMRRCDAAWCLKVLNTWNAPPKTDGR